MSRSAAAPVETSESAPGARRGAARRARELASSIADKPRLVVGLIVLVGALIAGVFSVQIVGYEPDEVGYSHLAMGIWHTLSPITLSHGGGQRPNQLYPLLIAPFWGPFGNVAAFRIVHVWNVLILASAAIPSYLLARELVARRWAAYLAATLVAFAPWATLSLAELTEVAAFPACAWALLAMQRALSDPSPKRDVVALAAIAFAAYGRLQLVMLAPALVIAMVLHEVGYALTGPEDRRTALGNVPARLARRHTPLSAFALVGLFAGVPLLLSGDLANLFGFYGDALRGATVNGATLDLARSYLVFIAIGLGVLPVVLTIGFVAESLVTPVSRRAHAFAALALVTTLLLTFQVAEVSVRFEEGLLQERYLFYIVPLFAAGMSAALLLSRHRFRMAAAGMVVLALLFATTHYQSVRNAFWYEVSPAMTGYYDWIHPAFGGAGGPTANAGASRPLLAGAIVLVVGLILAALLRRVSAARLLAGVAGVSIAFGGVQSVHSLWRVVNGSSSGKGYGKGTLHQVDWVDQSAPSGAQVTQLVSNVGGLDTSRGLWEDSEFWNRSIVGAETFGDVIDSYFATAPLRLDNESGQVTLKSSGSPPAQGYLVVAARGFPVAFAGSVLGHSPDGTLELVRVAAPLHAAWTLSGISGNGWLPLDRAATLRLYAASAPASRCAKIGVSASLSSLTASGRRLLLAAPGVKQEVEFAPGAARTTYVRICSPRGGVAQLELFNRQSPAAYDPQVTLQLRRVTVTPA